MGSVGNLIPTISLFSSTFNNFDVPGEEMADRWERSNAYFEGFNKGYRSGKRYRQMLLTVFGAAFFWGTAMILIAVYE